MHTYQTSKRIYVSERMIKKTTSHQQSRQISAHMLKRLAKVMKIQHLRNVPWWLLIPFRQSHIFQEN